MLSILLRRKHDMHGVLCLLSTLPLCHVPGVEGHSLWLLRRMSLPICENEFECIQASWLLVDVYSIAFDLSTG